MISIAVLLTVSDHPSCKSCKSANKECQYPVREKKLVFLDSQFQKLQDRIKFLESELKKKDLGGDIKVEEEFIDPFDKEVVGDKNYFGTAACQTFDSSLNSFLFKFTHNSNYEENDNLRYFLQDTNMKKSFRGVMMLPEKNYAIFLIDKVIGFLGYEYYFIDRHLIFQKLNETYDTVSDRDPVFCCYLLTILAVGEQYLNESPDGGVPGMRFFTPAMQLFQDYYENLTIEFIQTLLLIGFYQQGLNRVNAVYNFYGLALRNSMLMGLHKRVSDVHMTESEIEKRKKVWWTCFVLDSIWSSKLGHPIHINVEDIEIDLPDENSLRLNDDLSPELFTINVKLAILINKVMKKIYKTKIINLKNIVECLEDLDNFQKSLPVSIKKSIFSTTNRSSANLYLRLNQIVIITTRPLALSVFKGTISENPINKRVIQKCTIAAKTTIDILHHLKKSGWFSTFGFWDAQYCFLSLLILIMSSCCGHQYPQIAIGRETNQYMKEAGNFTAMENDLRLRKLDQLLENVKQYKRSQSDFNDMSPSYEFHGQIPQPKIPTLQSGFDQEELIMNEILENFTVNEFNYQDNESPLMKEDNHENPWNNLILNLQFWDSSIDL